MTVNLKRRQTLGMLGAGVLAACSVAPDGQSTSHINTQTTNTSAGMGASDNPSPQCYARTPQTEGPYFVDEQLNRSDIRSDPATGKISAGVPLTLRFVVSQTKAAACEPLLNAVVDIWHCDAAGEYSDVIDNNALFNTKGQKFLRGLQKTDEKGHVQFTTIYPGWYAGRAVHIHFKIRWTDASNHAHSFTSQLYFDDLISDAVFKNLPYNTKRARDTRNDEDFIYRRGGQDLMLNLSTDGAGFAATFSIGLS